MSAQLLAFPVQTSCPICKRPCGPDELAECSDCGDKFCGLCAWCSCDELAKDLAERMARLKPPSVLQRMWAFCFAA